MPGPDHYSSLRRLAMPAVVTIPEQLPIAAKAADILQLLASHQVVVVAGETGSGKTTQLPKICLQAGLGIKGLIGHTQPRRLAATSVAQRIAEELGIEPGQGVGYQIRFTDRTSDNTFLKVMTDGILLNELQKDPLLRRYEVLIIDEAHERSLNIDFILGYLKQLLPRRPGLKLIITSATIDLEKFSRHFADAPIVTVSGRSYPVEIRYQTLPEESESGNAEDPQTRGITEALQQLFRAERQAGAQAGGDVLIFFSSEKEIHETALHLRRQKFPHTEILPLYARLRQADQQRIFQPHTGRRIILSTNIAETSLTVPGIRYVIDTGLARVSRYSIHSKIQRLPIEPVSRASADQRAGRCGRVAAGICIRLYSEADYLARPAYTDPEILRTNLASVILQMLTLGLGDLEQFPFIDPPQTRAINDGFKLLYELNAIDEERQLTGMGRRMSQLPVDPRFARIMLAAHGYQCLREATVIVSALSIQDPREYPPDKRQQAQEVHGSYGDTKSDFMTLVNLWKRFETQRQALGQSQLRKYCARQFLSYSRMQEWRDVHRQLVSLCHGLGFDLHNREPDYATLHRSIICGLLNFIGSLDTASGHYLGTRNRKFRLLQGSVLWGKSARWIVCSQIIETDFAFAPMAAAIEPEWVAQEAGHLVKRSWSEPHWSKKRQQVLAWEKTTLYGLVLTDRQPINYGPLDPAVARELFIREALLERQLDTRMPFYRHNLRLLADLEKDEEKARRHGWILDERRLLEFYTQRIPEQVWDGQTFHHWYSRAQRRDPRLLEIKVSDLVAEETAAQLARDFPDQARVHNNRLPIHYAFAPGTSADGACIDVPRALLSQLQQQDLDWAVPGQLRERCTVLLKSLPKTLRKHFIPVPGFVDEALRRMSPADGSLVDALIKQAAVLKGVNLDRSLLQAAELPPHLQIKLRLLDEQGRELEAPADLQSLQRRHGGAQAAATVTGDTVQHAMERDGLIDWSFDELPERIEVGNSLKLQRYPALLDKGDGVAIRLLADPEQARRASIRGVVRLLRLRTRQQERLVLKQFADLEKRWGLKRPEFLQDLAEAATLCVYRTCFDVDKQLPRCRADFDKVLDQKSGITATAQRLEHMLQTLVDTYYQVRRSLADLPDSAYGWLKDDVSQQLSALFSDDFLSGLEAPWLWEYPRYLQAIQLRLEKAPLNAERDRQQTAQVRQYWQRWQALDDRLRDKPAVRQFRWLIEELRVSLFAQQLKTRQPVSPQRLDKAWDGITR
ncbi:MAG: ATP-dependent helicase HrpA [Pseudomonadota bacterium]